jgi:hypothetical protein
VQGVTSDPPDISSLEAWYKADSIVGLNDGDDVTPWQDQSGNGRHLSQSQPGSWVEPTYIASAVNGLPAVDFNPVGDPAGDDTFLELGLTVPDKYDLGSSAFTLFTVYTNAGNDHPYVFGDINAPVGYTGWSFIRAINLAGVPATAQVRFQNQTTLTISSPQTIANDGAYHVFSCGRDGAGAFFCNLDGSDVTAAGSPTSTAQLTFSALAEFGAGTKEVVLAEWLLYSRKLTTAEIAQVEAYLNAKYNLNDGGAGAGEDDLTLWNNAAGTTLTRVNSSGALGIGVDPDAYQLHVLDDGAAGQRIVATFDTDAATKRPTIQLSDGTDSHAVIGLNTGTIQIDRATGSVGMGLADAETFVLKRGSANVPTLLVKDGDSGSTSVSANAATAVFEGDGDAGITLLGGPAGAINLFYGTSANDDIGRISYRTANNDFAIWVNEVRSLFLGATGEPIVRFAQIASGSPSPSAGEGDIYMLGDPEELYFSNDTIETQLTSGGVGVHAIEDNDAPVTNKPTLNFFTGLDATVDGAKIDISIDPADAVNITGGGTWTFGQGDARIGTINLYGVSEDVYQLPASTSAETNTWTFHSWAGTGTGGVDGQVGFRFLLKGALAGGSPVNQPLEIEEDANNDIGLRLDADGTLWCAKGGSNYNWSGGLKEIPVLAADETIPIANLWNFEQGILLGDGSGADFSIWVDDVGGVPPYRRFYWDDSDTQFRFSEKVFGDGIIRTDSGLGYGVDPDANNLNYIQNTSLAVASGTLNLLTVVGHVLDTSGSASYVGVNFELRDKTQGQNTGTVYGAEFNVIFDDAASTRAAGPLTFGRHAAGLFSFANASDDNTAANQTRISFANCAYLRFQDLAGASPDVRINNLRMLEFELGSGNTTISAIHAIYVPDFTNRTHLTECDIMRIEAQDGANKGATKGNIVFEGGDWNTGHLQLGAAHIWSSGSIVRIAGQFPGDATDAAIHIEVASHTAKLGFFDVTTPITQPTALTSTLTTVTHTAPGTPDYAVASLIDSSVGSAWGFSTQDEGHTVLSVIANLQTRVDELETKLQSLGLIA